MHEDRDTARTRARNQIERDRRRRRRWRPSLNIQMYVTEESAVHVFNPELPPMAMVTRPQDWHPAARALLWPGAHHPYAPPNDHRPQRS